MNFHSDNYIMNRLQEHYNEALKSFKACQIVGIFLQGSQNYGLDYEGSDIDSKLIVVPTFKDIAMNKQAVSTTHIMENEEHVDFKDIRLYMQCFKKQNINFVEILYTNYKILNPAYEQLWKELERQREAIVHYNELAAVTCMKGTAGEKQFALEHKYPSKIEIIERLGYDPKQLHHLVRLKYFIKNYIAGKRYIECLVNDDITLNWLLSIKQGFFTYDRAKQLADETYKEVCEIYEKYKAEHPTAQIDEAIGDLLDRVQYDIMEKAVISEFEYKYLANLKN